MRAVTVGELKTRIRQRTDQTDSDFITDSELLDYINSAYAEYYGLIVSLYEDYNIKFASFTTTEANSYNLPTDFFKLKGVDFGTGTTYPVSLERFTFEDRNKYGTSFFLSGYETNVRYRLIGNTLTLVPAPGSDYECILWYIPSAEKLTNDNQIIDGINGYEELVVVGAALIIANKQESDAGAFLGSKRSLIQRIKEEAYQRDVGKPARVTDTRNLGLHDDNGDFNPYFRSRR